MNYKSFQKAITKEHGNFYSSQVEKFFEMAVDFAMKKKFSEAVTIANDALVFAKYSDVGYAIIYLIGMLCEAYLDNEQPELAETFFNYGMKIIDESNDTYDRDLNRFLDLKIDIDEALKKVEANKMN